MRFDFHQHQQLLQLHITDKHGDNKRCQNFSRLRPPSPPKTQLMLLVQRHVTVCTLYVYIYYSIKGQQATHVLLGKTI